MVKPTRVIYIRPEAKQFEVRNQQDLIGLVDYLRREVLDQPDKVAEVAVQIWTTITVHQHIPNGEGEEPKNPPNP